MAATLTALTKKVENARPIKKGQTYSTRVSVIQKVKDTIADVAAKNARGMATSLALAAQAKEPNVNAARLLWEYAGLKPSEKVEVSGSLGIVALVANLEHGDNTIPA